jgi:hypothetical protein
MHKKGRNSLWSMEKGRQFALSFVIEAHTIES